MKIAITDSGVGGLSVCAALERSLREQPLSQPIEVLYLNAALEDDYAYNSMATRQEKLETFGNFLDAVFSDYQPDRLFIACNTLSVLFDDPYYDRFREKPIRGIVETGVAELVAAQQLNPDAGIIVFATETTVASDAYGSGLALAGVPRERVVQQACPGLPDAISNDHSGGQARKLLARYIPEAVALFPDSPSTMLAFLGCTHYGYQAGCFEEGLKAVGKAVRVVNPNTAAARTIRSGLSAQQASLPAAGASFRVISRYAIPAAPLASLSSYLGERAPATLEALRRFEHRPDFFHGMRNA